MRTTAGRILIVLGAAALIVLGAKVYENGPHLAAPIVSTTTTTCPTLNCQLARSVPSTTSPEDPNATEQAKVNAQIAALQAEASKPPVVITSIAPPTPTTLPYCTLQFINPLWSDATYCAPNASDPPYYCPDMQLTPVLCAQIFPNAYRP